LGATPDDAFEIFDGPRDTLCEGDSWTPAELGLGEADVRLALPRIVGRQALKTVGEDDPVICLTRPAVSGTVSSVRLPRFLTTLQAVIIHRSLEHYLELIHALAELHGKAFGRDVGT
jgi:hypothetical protein